MENIILENKYPFENHDGKIWCIGKIAAQQLPKSKIIELAKWATTKNYNAVLWTGLTMTKGYDRNALLQFLR